MTIRDSSAATVRHTRLLIVDPVGRNIEFAVSRLPRASSIARSRPVAGTAPESGVRPADDVGQGEDCRARWPEELGQEISAAVAVPDDRNIGADRKLEIDRVEEVDAVGVH